MSGPAIVWLIVGLVSTVAVLVLLIGLVRHVIVLGRALGRFQREVAPIAADIAEVGERASRRSCGLEQRAGKPAGGDRGVP